MSMVITSAETRVMDPAALEAVSHLFEVVEFSENRIVDESQKTQAVVQQAFGQMQGHLSTLSEENHKLRVELTAEQTRQRETEQLHLAELKALREQLAAAQSEVAMVRQDMSKTVRKANEAVSVALQDKTKAVELATKAADERVAAIRSSSAIELAAAVASATSSTEWRFLNALQPLKNEAARIAAYFKPRYQEADARRNNPPQRQNHESVSYGEALATSRETYSHCSTGEWFLRELNNIK